MSAARPNPWPAATEDDDAFITLVDRFLSGDATADDAAELNAALREAPGRVALFAALAIESEHLQAAQQPAAAALVCVAERIGSHRTAWAIAAALLLSVAAVAIYVFAINPERPGSGRSASVIATLVDASGTVIINDDIANPGSDYAPGDYSIETGSAELLLRSRVSISMRDATRLEVATPMLARLKRGSASFRCPSGAAGFTVELTDGSRIIDLGTAFEVTADAAGRHRVRVSEGAVRLERPGLDSVRLEAGRSVRLTEKAIVDLLDDVALPLVNGDFDTEGVAGWTITSTGANSAFWATDGSGLGKVDPTTGHGPSAGFLTANRLATEPDTPADRAATPVTSYAAQRIDLSGYADDIDLSGVTVAVSFQYSSPAVEDDAFVQVEFFDSAGESLDSTTTPELANTNAYAWSAANVANGALPVPAHARSMKITLIAVRNSQSSTNISFDSIRAALHGVSRIPTPAGGGDQRPRDATETDGPPASN